MSTLRIVQLNINRSRNATQLFVEGYNGRRPEIGILQHCNPASLRQIEAAGAIVVEYVILSQMDFDTSRRQIDENEEAERLKESQQTRSTLQRVWDWMM